MVGGHEECMTEMKWESTGSYANAPQGEEALALLFGCGALMAIGPWC